jgi:hypothetical protein
VCVCVCARARARVHVCELSHGPFRRLNIVPPGTAFYSCGFLVWIMTRAGEERGQAGYKSAPSSLY